MKKLIFAQLLAVSIMMSLSRPCAAAASPPVAAAAAPAIIIETSPQGRRLFVLAYLLAERRLERERRQLLHGPPSARPVFREFGALSPAKLPPVIIRVRQEEMSIEECKKVLEGLLGELDKMDTMLDDLEKTINSQMGETSSKLGRSKFWNTFKKTMEHVGKKSAAAGRAVVGVGRLAGLLMGPIGIAFDIWTMTELMVEWDQETEQLWAEDLRDSGQAASMEEAFQMAEQMGDFRMHWFMENDPLRSAIAEWYHDKELLQDRRECLAQDHSRQKDRLEQSKIKMIPSHEPTTRPGWQQRGRAGDSSLGSSCLRAEVKHEYKDGVDENGNPTLTVIAKEICVEWR